MNALALIGGFGLPELMVILTILSLGLVVIWPAWRILTKAGFPGWLAIAAVIPMVNVALLVFVAFTEWPIERELREARRQ